MRSAPFQTTMPAPIGADALLQQARRAFQAGALSAEELLPPALAYVSRSWRRSVEAGLDAFAPQPQAPHLSRIELAQAAEHHQKLLTHAKPVMEYLLGQTRAHKGMVILADANGLLLQALGDNRFLQRAERVALSPGASWHEAHRGTNAIGTALAETAPVMVHGVEHFLECNGFLSCAAAPVRSPSGQVLAVLDFSSERQLAPPQVFGAVCAAAQMIENRLFLAAHGHQLRLYFHPLPEGLGTLAEGLVAISEEGCIAAANAAALDLLGISGAQLGHIRLHQALEADLHSLLRSAHSGAGTLQLRTSARPHRLLHARAVPGMAPGAVSRIGNTSISNTSKNALENTIEAPNTPGSLPAPFHALDTGDTAWRAVLGKAAKVLNRPIALLLQGESGTGKEVLARAIHQSSARAAQPFVAVNCAALPENLIEAELFGYAPGAFTGGRREGSPGLIRQAHQGTLFLDEIGDMPLPLQTRLLRVLQERQVTPLGAAAPVPVDFALICASHRDLKAEVAAGRFRDDLYWRINGLYLKLPALRQRSDLPQLIERLLQYHAGEQGVPAPQLSEPVAQALCHYAWPGNLRQLDSVLRTAVALAADQGQIDWECLPDDLLPELQRDHHGDHYHQDVFQPVDPMPAAQRAQQPQSQFQQQQQQQQQTLQPSAAIAESLADATLQTLQRAVANAGGNMSQAARSLGISRNTLYRKLRHAKG